jgi:excisionase family DNA binding protein
MRPQDSTGVEIDGEEAMTESTHVEWMPDAPLLLNKRQAAALLNVSERTVSNLLRLRRLVARKVGARTLIPRSSIEAFLRRDHPTGNHGQGGEDG